jgi:diguanylate cyclase (GGDEF)-like protein/PAS domain S-box-containing protein
MKVPRLWQILCWRARRAGTTEPSYQRLFNSIPIGLYVTTPDGRLIDANDELVRMLGYRDKASLAARSADELYVRPEDRLVELGLLARDGGVRRFETQLRRADGTSIAVLDTCRAVANGRGKVVRFEGSLQDITEEKKLQEGLHTMARRDPLTGVYNRYALDETLSDEVARSQRYRHPIGLLMIDIDQFKAFNDRFGHAAGDKILKRVASVLTRCVRGTDIVVRFGGDEFLVLLVETNGEVSHVKCRIKSTLETELAATEYGVPIHVSIGAAHWSPDTGESIETLLTRADRAMYEEKDACR